MNVSGIYLTEAPLARLALVARARAFLTCRFGGVHSSQGTFVTTGIMSCLLPPLPYHIGQAGVSSKMLVEVSLDGKHFEAAKGPPVPGCSRA